MRLWKERKTSRLFDRENKFWGNHVKAGYIIIYWKILGNAYYYKLSRTSWILFSICKASNVCFQALNRISSLKSTFWGSKEVLITFNFKIFLFLVKTFWSEPFFSESSLGQDLTYVVSYLVQVLADLWYDMLKKILLDNEDTIPVEFDWLCWKIL